MLKRYMFGLCAAAAAAQIISAAAHATPLAHGRNGSSHGGWGSGGPNFMNEFRLNHDDDRWFDDHEDSHESQGHGGNKGLLSLILGGFNDTHYYGGGNNSFQYGRGHGDDDNDHHDGNNGRRYDDDDDDDHDGDHDGRRHGDDDDDDHDNDGHKGRHDNDDDDDHDDDDDDKHDKGHDDDNWWEDGEFDGHPDWGWDPSKHRIGCLYDHDKDDDCRTNTKCVPVPGAALLGSLGLMLAGAVRRRQA